MEIKVGDIYIRQKDGKTYTVKKIDNEMIVLESENGKLTLIEIFGFERAYTKKEPSP